MSELAYAVAERSGQRHVVARGAARAAGDAGAAPSLADLTARAADQRRSWAPLLQTGSLDPLLAAGPATWRRVDEWALEELTRPQLARPLGDARLVLAFSVADYVDFYSSRVHAETVGRILRPASPALPPSWLDLPIGYHGRSGTVVVSGTGVVRPRGLARPDPDSAPRFGPTTRLDVEVEVGFVVGVGSVLGEPVPAERWREHVFGVVLVNDWSARDIQAFEYVPLGPLLGKSFATSVSAWVTPLSALDAARVPPPPRDRPLAGYLDDPAEPAGLDLRLQLEVNGTVVARPRFAAMYWTPAQQLAHLTVNGACLRTGDLFASGTVSGAGEDERGCLLELTWGGSRPLALPDGRRLGYLADGDEVVIRGAAPDGGGRSVALGEVRGRVLPATAAGPAAG